MNNNNNRMKKENLIKFNERGMLSLQKAFHKRSYADSIVKITKAVKKIGITFTLWMH